MFILLGTCRIVICFTSLNTPVSVRPPEDSVWTLWLMVTCSLRPNKIKSRKNYFLLRISLVLRFQLSIHNKYRITTCSKYCTLNIQRDFPKMVINSSLVMFIRLKTVECSLIECLFISSKVHLNAFFLCFLRFFVLLY